MRSFLGLSFGVALLLTLCVPATYGQAVRAPIYSVGYLDVAPSSERTAIELLRQYRDASRQGDGFVRFDLLEQIGRPGRFMLLEAWQDQKTLDAHAMSAQTRQFFDKLKPLAIGAYDQRPYQSLGASPVSAVISAAAVYGVMHIDTIPSPQSSAMALLQQFTEASRKEDGNLRFDLVQHPMRMNHFTVIEVWRDQKAADAHALAALTKKFRDDLLPILGSPYDDRFYKAIE
jgi:autoinducer 2-degrading protein